MSNEDKIITGTTVIELWKTSYTWVIKNFRFLICLKDKKLKSPIFSMGKDNEINWRLRMYPSSDNPLEGRLGLYLQLMTPTENPIYATFTMYLIKTNGVKLQLMSHNVRCFNRGTSRGKDKILNRRTIAKNYKAFLHDDENLKILCEVSVGTGNETSRPSIEHRGITQPDSDLCRDLRALLDHGNMSDFTVIADEQKFPVHKAILAARSTVFAAMFAHGTLESIKNEVEITDVRAEVMEQLVRFIYTGKTDKLEALAGELLAAADKYAVEDLKQICAQQLDKSLAVNTIIDIFKLADRHNVPWLKVKAMSFMRTNSSRVVDHVLYVHQQRNLM